MEPFLGEIRMFAGFYAPQGWMLCQGQPLAITQYQALFSLLGNKYGGDGKTTFNLPDFRGRLPVHVGEGIVLGQKGGEYANTLTIAQMPPHTHQPLNNFVKCNNTVGGDSNPSGKYPGFSTIDMSYAYLNTGAAVYAANAETIVSTAGGGEPLNNMMPSLCINYIIAIVGEFPSHY